MAIFRLDRWICWAAFSFLLGLSNPTVAAPSDTVQPTLARLSFWVPPERMGDFAEIYETEVKPQLKQRGLVATTESSRPILDGVFNRSFAVGSLEEALEIERTLAADSTWTTALKQWGKALGISALRAQFRVYKTPAGLGKTKTAGPGFRQGVWQTFSVEDGLPGSMVVETMQDRSGDLWFAGIGVCRYDGYSFTTFTNIDGLASSLVGTM